jgi:hypothetical protein
MAFPPVPVFPEAIDSDYTLFLVHNTTETRLCQDNSAWAEEIDIVPVGEDKCEIWADNGFGNIEGELFYYDSVDKDESGKVKKLKGCARNLGGKRTRFNPKGTWVRSFVVAEHHNQIATAILKVEDFVGYNFDPRQETLDWRIRNLQELDVIFDDYNCPDVNFIFTIVENNPTTGILADYSVQITPPGNINTFRLDFGDGTFTTSALSGTHRYAQNASIDPIVSVGNDQCQAIQTAITRENPSEPPPIIPDVFEFPVPESIDIPDFTLVPVEVPEPDVALPPIVQPCFSFEGQIGPLPSVIIGPDINLVSTVEIIGPDNPVNLPHSVIRIEGDVNVPSLIFVDITPTIVIDPPIPPTIVIVASQASALSFDVNFANVPKLEVDWGGSPKMEVELAFAKTPKVRALSSNEFGDEFSDLFEAEEHTTIEYETVGLPSSIELIAPKIEDINFNVDNIPKTIELELKECNIPKDIYVHAEGALQTGVINIQGLSDVHLIHDLHDGIELIAPKAIPVEFVGELPKIVVEMAQPIPDRIIIDASGLPTSIPVTGIPDFLEVRFPEEMPEIGVKFPDKMPEMELVYRGTPIEVKITMDQLLKSSEDGGSCVMIVPCR